MQKKLKQKTRWPQENIKQLNNELLSQCVLEIDAGNTRLKWRLIVEKDANIKIMQRGFLSNKTLKKCIKKNQKKNQVTGDVENLKYLIKTVRRVRVASVADQRLKDFIQAQLVNDEKSNKLFFAKSQAHCAGVKNAYEHTQRLGVDRWLAMIAAYHAPQQETVSLSSINNKTACCIIDCGSAVTIDYVAANGEHAGGYIVPGLTMLESSLLNKTAEIKIENKAAFVEEQSNQASAEKISWATTTQQAVQQGKLLLLGAWLTSLIKEVQQQDARVFISGGDAPQIILQIEAQLKRQHAPQIKALLTHQPDLVLDGLRYCDSFNA